MVTQNVKITIGTSFTGLKPTTIPDGVYTVQFKAKAGNPKFAQNGTYALANLAGDFGWADQAKRQDFNHMPAAQWVVKRMEFLLRLRSRSRTESSMIGELMRLLKVFCLRLQPNSMRWKVAVMSFISMEQCPIH